MPHRSAYTTYTWNCAYSQSAIHCMHWAIVHGVPCSRNCSKFAVWPPNEDQPVIKSSCAAYNHRWCLPWAWIWVFLCGFLWDRLQLNRQQRISMQWNECEFTMLTWKSRGNQECGGKEKIQHCIYAWLCAFSARIQNAKKKNETNSFSFLLRKLITLPTNTNVCACLVCEMEYGTPERTGASYKWCFCWRCSINLSLYLEQHEKICASFIRATIVVMRRVHDAENVTIFIIQF